MSTSYDALADKAERGKLTVEPRTVHSGSETQRILMEATETSTADEAARWQWAGPAAGQSPVARARVPRHLKDQ